MVEQLLRVLSAGSPCSWLTNVRWLERRVPAQIVPSYSHVWSRGFGLLPCLRGCSALLGTACKSRIDQCQM